MHIENASTTIRGKLKSINISQIRGKIYLNEWDTPGLIKTISADVFFKNPAVKILYNLKKKISCINSNSIQILNIESVKGKINCITY